MKRRSLLCGGAAFCFSQKVFATEKVDQLKAISGDRLQNGDLEYLLADIIAPPLYHLGRTAPPYFEVSRMVLQSLLDENDIDMQRIGITTRWQVEVVDMRFRERDQTLQESLISVGAARVAPQTDRPEFIDALLTLERHARKKGLGLWSHDAYQVIEAENAYRAIGAFHLVTGVVKEIADTRSRMYLNFGEDYKTDFTASVRAGLARRWRAQGLDLSSLKDKRVLVRGFVNDINGPSIELKHRQQIEVVER